MKSHLALVLALTLAGSLHVAGTTLNWTPLHEPGCGGDIAAIGVSPNNSNLVLLGGDILGIGVSSDGAGTWNTTFGLRGYEIAEFTFGPASQSSTVWAATMDGPYLSTDSGVNWTSLRNGMPADGGFSSYSAPIQKMLLDPSNSAHLLAFGGNHRGYNTGSCKNFGAVWETTNSGQNWSLKTRVISGQTGNGANITSAVLGGGSFSTLYVSIPGYGIYKSTDGDGAAWTAANTGLPSNNVDKLVAHPTDANTLWVSFNDGKGIYKTTNGGASWTACNTGLNTSGDFNSLAVSASNPSVLYAADYSPTNLYQSTNGGASWTQLTNVPANAYNFGFQGSYLAIDPSNASSVYLGTYVTLYHTTNGGSSWVDATAYNPGGNSSLWRGRGYSGLVARAFKWNPYNTNQTAFAAMDAGKLWQSIDNMTSWQNQSGLNLFGGGNDVTFGSDGQTLYGAFGQYGWYQSEGVAKSTNGGVSWSYCSNPASGNAIAYAVYTLPAATNNVWAVFQDSQLYYSNNSGSTWTKIVTNDPEIDSIAAPTTNGTNPATAVLYVGGRSAVYQVTGTTAAVLGSGGPYTQAYGHMQVRMDPVNQSEVYACNWQYDIYNSGVWRYTPAGGWTRLITDYDAYDVAVDPSNTQRIVYVSNDNPTNDATSASGVWMSENGGSTWTQNNGGLGFLRAQCVAFKPGGGQIVVGLNGRGYYTSSLQGIVVTAQGASNQVNLSWTTYPGASSYRIYRSVGNDTSYSWLVNGWGSPNYTDTAVTNGTVYYYKVSALDANHNELAGSISVEQSATPASAGITLSLTPGSGQIGLVWNAYSGASSYRIYRSVGNDTSYSWLVNGWGSPNYTDTSVSSGTRYYYKVSALDSNHNEIAASVSPEQSATPH